MKEYETYLFDFDGTLLDTRESLFPVFLAGFKAIGKECTPEDAREYMHHSLEVAAEMAKLTPEEIPAWVNAIIKALDSKESLDMIKIFPDTVETIKKLKSVGKRLAIVTGNTPSHVQIVLANFGLEGIFETAVGAGDYKHSKPNGEPCLVALKRLGVDKKSAVYIGDSLQDIASAKDAGIDGILVDRGNLHPEIKENRISGLDQLFS